MCVGRGAIDLSVHLYSRFTPASAGTQRTKEPLTNTEQRQQKQGDIYLSAESASVLAVLGDFHLLDLLTERGTITDTVFTNNSDLLSALSLLNRKLRFWLGICRTLSIQLMHSP